MAESSHHVQFPEGVKVEERPKPKQQPTQKYDRKEIQKRLDIESWMEEQLADLFQVRNRGSAGSDWVRVIWGGEGREVWGGEGREDSEQF